MKEKIDKLDFNKIKNFYSTKELVIDFFFFFLRQATDWEKRHATTYPTTKNTSI